VVVQVRREVLPLQTGLGDAVRVTVGSAGTSLSALQEAVVPPLLPAQVQYQGPVPLIAEAVPATQFTEVGADVSVSPSGEPHTPLTFELTDTVAELLAEPQSFVQVRV